MILATGVDPEEEGMVYTDPVTVQSNDNLPTVVGVIMPVTPSRIQERPTSETLTSEHGGANEPSLPPLADTPLLATNLNQRLETAADVSSAVGTGDNATGNTSASTLR